MAYTISVSKKMKKVIRRGGDIYYVSKKEKPFGEEVYASVQESNGKYVVDTIDNGKGHYLGYSHKNHEPARYSKDIANKKAIEWMKKKGEY
jgi:hypothetical protein